jgi:hypothetical protein
MRITKRQLRRIIKEEKAKVLLESSGAHRDLVDLFRAESPLDDADGFQLAQQALEIFDMHGVEDSDQQDNMIYSVADQVGQGDSYGVRAIIDALGDM